MVTDVIFDCAMQDMDNCTDCDLTIPVPLTKVICDETVLRIEVLDSKTMLPVPGTEVEVTPTDSEEEPDISKCFIMSL